MKENNLYPFIVRDPFEILSNILRVQLNGDFDGDIPVTKIMLVNDIERIRLDGDYDGVPEYEKNFKF